MNKGWNDTSHKVLQSAKNVTVCDASQALDKLLILKALNPAVHDLDLCNFDQTYEFPEWDNLSVEKVLASNL